MSIEMPGASMLMRGQFSQQDGGNEVRGEDAEFARGGGGSNSGLISMVRWICSSTSRTGSVRLTASGVRIRLRPTGTSSSSLKYSRRRASTPLVADWLRFRRREARVMLFSLSSASSATSRLRSRRLKRMLSPVF
jgi:hypothetical protein